jgi:isopenicillin-N N-acyltransferase like protein
MSAAAMQILHLEGSPSHLGQVHGRALAGQIADYLEDRLALSTDERWSGAGAPRDLILETAEMTLEHHRKFSGRLFEEMAAMAEAAGITPAEAVVTGGFTDLVDAVRARVGAGPTEDDCTAVINPGLGYLAQTWDMHSSAQDYVVVLDLRPDSGPRAVVQTTAGCLGQIGMNEAGIAIGINNLTSWGRPGVTWPFVVRKVLEQTKLDDAVGVVVDARLAGGHNFLLLGPDGEGANIEAMPRHKEVTRVSARPFVHSNHCLVDATRSEEADRSEVSVNSSDLRLELGARHAADLDAFFASPDISRRATPEYDIATCGAVVMEPGDRRMKATIGVPGDNPWTTFGL